MARAVCQRLVEDSRGLWGACGRRRRAESRGAWRRGTSQSGRGAVAHDRQRKNVKGLVIAYPSAEKRVEKGQSCEGKTGCSGQETGPQVDGDGRVARRRRPAAKAARTAAGR